MPKNFFVEGVVGRAHPTLGHVHVQFEFVDVRHAIDVMNVIVEKLSSGIDRKNRLQRRRMPHRHLQRIEAAPRDAKHAHIPVRPRLVRKPGNNLLAIDLLLLGILAFGRNTFTGAEAADIHSDPNVSTPCEVGMLGIISGSGSVIFAVWQVFEQGREFLSRLGAIRHVERRGQADAIFHRDPSLL